MQAFTYGNHFAVVHPNFIGHVLLEELEGGQVGWEAGPQVPGAEIDDEMKLAVADAGIDAAQALGVSEENGLAAADRHVRLVGVVAVFLVHLDDFGNLDFEVLAVGILLTVASLGGHDVGQVAFNVFHGGGGWYPLRDTGYQRSGVWVLHLYDDQVEFFSSLT